MGSFWLHCVKNQFLYLTLIYFIILHHIINNILYPFFDVDLQIFSAFWQIIFSSYCLIFAVIVLIALFINTVFDTKICVDDELVEVITWQRNVAD